MTAIHCARLCTSQAAIPAPPAPPGQDLDATSGEGRGGGAHAATAAASAQAEPAHDSEFVPTAADGDEMVDDAPGAYEQEAPVHGELAKLQDGLAALAVKPGAKNHLVVIGNELDSQFKKATQRVPNQEYFPVLLEHTGGFQRIISMLTKENPDHVGELVIVIGDVELALIRALPTTSRNERILVGRRMQGLIGAIVAAVDIGLALNHSPDVSIYVWDELGKGSDELSATMSDSLIDFYRRAKRMKVLSQFQRDENGKIGSEAETIRKLWHANASQVPTCRN